LLWLVRKSHYIYNITYHCVFNAPTWEVFNNNATLIERNRIRNNLLHTNHFKITDFKN